MQTQMSSKDYPKRGEVFVADLDPAFGREIHKKRPVLIISSNKLNKALFTVVVIPFSSIIPQFIGPDMVRVNSADAGVEEESVILPNYIRAVDKIRLLKKIGKLSRTKLEEVEEAIKAVFDLQG